jgi:hypothetical protein
MTKPEDWKLASQVFKVWNVTKRLEKNVDALLVKVIQEFFNAWVIFGTLE